MNVEQIYSLMNGVTAEILGRENVVQEDLQNVVDVGTEIFGNTSVDNYVKSLVNHIGKVIFVNRPYSGNVPSVLMDSWEFGSVLEKIQADLPTATENESWNLEDGHEYKQDIFYKPSVSAKFFNKRVTFEVPMSFTERQVKESFSSREQLNGFLSMLYNSVDKSMSVKIDSLIMRTINNMIAETIFDEYGNNNYGSKSGIKAVNLLYLYNEKFNKTLMAKDCLTDKEFIRFTVYTMGLYKDRLSKISTLFNIGKKERFTPSDMLKTVLLSDFVNASKAYLQSDTFNMELVSAPKAETVPYWQGSGKNYLFGDITAVNAVTANNHNVAVTGVIGVMFDRDSLGVSNLDKRVTTAYNAKAEFFNNFYKFDAGYFNDFNENFVVFFVADNPSFYTLTEDVTGISGMTKQGITTNPKVGLTYQGTMVANEGMDSISAVPHLSIVSGSGSDSVVLFDSDYTEIETGKYSVDVTLDTPPTDSTVTATYTGTAVSVVGGAKNTKK